MQFTRMLSGPSPTDRSRTGAHRRRACPHCAGTGQRRASEDPRNVLPPPQQCTPGRLRHAAKSDGAVTGHREEVQGLFPARKWFRGWAREAAAAALAARSAVPSLGMNRGRRVRLWGAAFSRGGSRRGGAAAAGQAAAAFRFRPCARTAPGASGERPVPGRAGPAPGARWRRRRLERCEEGRNARRRRRYLGISRRCPGRWRLSQCLVAPGPGRVENSSVADAPARATAMRARRPVDRPRCNAGMAGLRQGRCTCRSRPARPALHRRTPMDPDPHRRRSAPPHPCQPSVHTTERAPAPRPSST